LITTDITVGLVAMSALLAETISAAMVSALTSMTTMRVAVRVDASVLKGNTVALEAATTSKFHDQRVEGVAISVQLVKSAKKVSA
jgi:hypothetical protein